MKTFTYRGQEWMVEPVGAQRGGHTRVRFVSRTSRLEAFGHVAAQADTLDGVADAELARSLEAALADQSLS